MKFFLDENFPKIAVKYLEKLGHETYDIRSTPKEGIDDDSIFSLAQEKSATFLTTDRDFFHTIPYKYSSHMGVIVISLRQPNRKRIMAKLTWIIEKSKIDNFINKIILLKDNSYTIRK
jgi:predicted nuclease of predicted toxin-antitoxin system